MQDKEQEVGEVSELRHSFVAMVLPIQRGGAVTPTMVGCIHNSLAIMASELIMSKKLFDPACLFVPYSRFVVRSPLSFGAIPRLTFQWSVIFFRLGLTKP